MFNFNLSTETIIYRLIATAKGLGDPFAGLVMQAQKALRQMEKEGQEEFEDPDRAFADLDNADGDEGKPRGRGKGRGRGRGRARGKTAKTAPSAASHGVPVDHVEGGAEVVETTEKVQGPEADVSNAAKRPHEEGDAPPAVTPKKKAKRKPAKRAGANTPENAAKKGKKEEDASPTPEDWYQIP